MTTLAMFFICQHYEKWQKESSIRVVKDMQHVFEQEGLIEPELAFVKSFFQDHPETVYVLLRDSVQKRELGLINVESFKHGGAFINDMIQSQGLRNTVRSLKKQQVSPNRFINLFQDIWFEQSMKVQFAYLNPMRYQQWGLREKILPWALNAWYAIGILTGLMMLIFMQPPVLSRSRRSRKKTTSSSLEDEKENIKFLQDRAQKAEEHDTQSLAPLHQTKEPLKDESQKPITQEDVTKIDQIPPQIWIRLLDEPDLKDWDTKGDFYVREDRKGLHAVGFPWASSIITRKEVLFPEFVFEVEARVLAGDEGFCMLFQVGGHSLTWILGGWNNSHSVVLDYDATKTEHQILKKKWYHVRVELEDDELTGYIEGRTAWKLPKADITKDSQDVGFQKGLGVGVYKTTTKFRNVRILKV